MAVTDYSTLKTTVANYLHRTDLTANIPDFISMAEWRIARALRISQLLTTSTLSVTAAAATTALPTGFLEIANVKIANGAELSYVPPDRIDQVSGAGVPWVYSLVGANIMLAPSWTAGGSLTVTHWAKQTELSDSNTTNWYVTNAPDSLLYGALLESAPFLQSDNRITVWQQFFDQSIASLNAQYGNLDPHKRQLAYSQPGLNAGSDLRNAA